jgi:hypothetical protein
MMDPLEALEAANRRIAEQVYLMGLADQHRKELEQRAEEAERKLADLRMLARRELSRKSYTPERAKEMWAHALRICGPGEGYGILRTQDDRIEQPQNKPTERLTKDEWAAINKLRGETIDHKIGSGVETPLFTALQKIADWHLESFDQQREEALRRVEALAQIEQPQEGTKDGN